MSILFLPKERSPGNGAWGENTVATPAGSRENEQRLFGGATGLPEVLVEAGGGEGWTAGQP